MPTSPVDGDQPALPCKAFTDTMKARVVRRLVGGAAIVAGALLMWLSPKALEGAELLAGGALMAAGVALELIGIALERKS
jgi:hypothetical protein